MRMDAYVAWVTSYAKAYRAPSGPTTNSGCSTARTSHGNGESSAAFVALACALAACARRRATKTSTSTRAA
jgi:hypothetical protein